MKWGMVAVVYALALIARLATAAGLEEKLAPMEGCFSVTYHFAEAGHKDFVIKGGFERIEKTGPTSFQRYGIFEGQKFKHFAESWTLGSKGETVQEVISPTGRRRYLCPGQWQGEAQFSCSALGTPKPTRDTEREDYDVVDRQCVIQFTGQGFVQNEVNLKRNFAGELKSSEVGWIAYDRASPENCVVKAQP